MTAWYPGGRAARAHTLAGAPPAGDGRGLHLPRAELDDPRWLVPFNDAFAVRPLWIAPQRQMWCDILTARRPGRVRSHSHPYPVFGYTLGGHWHYRERPEAVVRTGGFVVEPAGRPHTLVAQGDALPVRVLFLVQGPLVWLDDDGHPDGYFDVHQYVALCRRHFERVGLGAGALERLMR